MLERKSDKDIYTKYLKATYGHLTFSVFGKVRVLLKVSPPVIIYTEKFSFNSRELFYIEQNGKMKSIYAYPNYATTLSESNLNKYRMFLDQDRILHHRIPLLAPQSGITKAV